MVKIRVGGDTKDFEQKLTGLGQTGEKALSGLKTAIAALGIGKLAQEIFQTGLAFESAFAGVIKTVDATDAELAQMRDGFLALSQEIPVTASELASIGESAGQLGIANENILTFTETMANLAVATNLTSEEAATLLARFANVTGLPQTEFENLGSAVVALGNTMATTESEIVAMAQRMAGAATNAGFAESEIMALAASLSSVGIEAQAGGTSMVRTMNTIDGAVRASGDELAKLAEVTGMTSEQFAAMWSDNAAGAFDALIKGLGEVSASGGSVAGTLEELGITATLDITALTSLAGASDLFSSAMETANTAFEENTALANEAEQRYKTLESQIQLFTNSAQALAVGIYDTMRPAFVDAMTGMSAAMQDLQTSFARPDIQNALGAIGDSLAIFATQASKLIATVLPPLVRIIGAVASAANQMFEMFKPLADFFMGTLGGALDLAASAFEGIASNMQVFGPIIVAVTVAYLAWTIATGIQTAMLAAQKKAMEDVNNTAKFSIMEKVALAVAEGGLAAVTGVATAAFHGLNAAMNANIIGLVIAGIAALTAGIIAAIMWFNRDSDALKQLNEDTEAVIEANNALKDSMAASADAHVENLAAIDNEAAANDHLITSLLAAQSSYDGSAVSASKMRVMVDQLNAGVEGLNLSFDEQTGQLNMNEDALRALAAAQRENAKAQAEAARATELTQELVKQEESMRILQAQLDGWSASLAAGDIDQREFDKGTAELIADMGILADSISLTEENIDYYNTAAAEAAVASEEAANAAAYSEENLQALAEQYGVTVEAIRAATDGTVASLDEWQAAQEETAAATAETTQAMADRYSELANEAENALGRITQAEALNAQQLIANVQANTDTMNAFADNLAASRAKVASDEYSPIAALVEQLGAMGPEYADQLAVIASMTDTELASLVDAFGGNAEAAAAAMAAEFGLPANTNVGSDATDAIAAAMEANNALETAGTTTVQNAVTAIENTISAANMPGIGRNMAEGMANGVRAGGGTLSAAMEAVVNDAIAKAKKAAETASPSKRTRRELGLPLAQGLTLGIKDGTKDAISAAHDQAEAVLSAYSGIDPNIEVGSLAEQMVGMFDDVPAEFFAMGETAGAQFVAGFNAAAFGFFALFEQMMAGDVLMASTVGGGARSGTNVEMHFHEQVDAPDTVAREVLKVMTYGLAGERN